jgi:uncharacterized protein YaaQ
VCLRVLPARARSRDRSGASITPERGDGIVHRPYRGVRANGRTDTRQWAILRHVKLVVAIVHNEDAGALVNALLEREFRATRLHSSGGFLKQSNATVMLGVEDDEVDEVMGIVREACHARTQIVNPMPPIMEPGEFFMPYPLEVEVGGATVFVVPVERFERL